MPYSEHQFTFYELDGSIIIFSEIPNHKEFFMEWYIYTPHKEFRYCSVNDLLTPAKSHQILMIGLMKMNSQHYQW